MRLQAIFLTTVCGATVIAAPAQGAAAQDGSTGRSGVEQTPDMPREIVVTARRREESLQSVPVSVSAFTAETINEQQIRELKDLTVSTPGLVFTQSGSGPNVNITLRGQTKSTVGAGLPSVITYFNDVPLPTYGSSLPTFDLASIQVLKGPQGTYFGRNTTGGAVLVSSQQPTYEFEGYASLIYGSYNWLESEGAINLPLVKDKAALRVAFNQIDRDGYTKNLSIPGKDWDDRNDRAFRASLLIEPFAGLRNITVADYQKVDTVGLSSIVINAFDAGGARNPALAPFYNCSEATSVTANCDPSAPTPQNDVDLALERQQEIGIRAGYTGQLPVTRYSVRGISNTTSLDIGAVTIKNIFGFRAVTFDSESNTDGIELPLVNSHFRQDDRQISNELQASGGLFDGTLSWLVGGFYLKGYPGGVSGRTLEIFRTPSTVVDNLPFSQSYYRDTSKALFGQLIYDMSALVEGLSINAGYRQTWDKQSLCAIASPYGDPRIDEDSCRDNDASFQQTAKFDAATWTIGADWQATRNLFFYVTARKGYRGGGINAPELGGILTDYQYFEPETLKDVELGAKVDWRSGDVEGRFNLAAYRGKYRNIQGNASSIPANFDGDDNPSNDPASSTLVVNRGAATIQGLELDGFVSPFQGLTLNFGAAYTDAKFTNFDLPPLFSSLSSGTPSFNATPDWTMSGGVRYEAELGSDVGELVFNANIYHSSSLNYTAIHQSAYEVVNARLDWQGMFGSDASIGFFVRNLFKEKYITGSNLSSSGTTIVTGPYGAPRMVGLQIRYDFVN